MESLIKESIGRRRVERGGKEKRQREGEGEEKKKT